MWNYHLQANTGYAYADIILIARNMTDVVEVFQILEDVYKRQVYDHYFILPYLED